MEYSVRLSSIAIIGILLAGMTVIAGATPVPPDSSITYTISLKDDGTANWHVEYRTLLASDEDLEAFDSYTKNVSSTYLPRFQELMQRSAAQAAAATSRPMEITDFTGDAVIQTTPTGRYGIVYYSFNWKNFAKTVPDLAIGDAFAGGLYLAKDNTLVIRYPSGYSVSAAEPAPDQVRDGLIWYGQRSFGAGEPRMVFEKPGAPWLPLLLGLLCVLILGGLYVVLSKRRAPEPVEAEDPPVTLSETELLSLEERIIQLLKASGGEQYQSEIVKHLGLPKSTVSATLNDLHQRGVIQKVKKGRENLIRLV
ncbi:MAG: helix-turn-helix domain-containing protein [Methanoregula sp.]|nr:helix-turn-helix domain-containing protein [Methanoregula sp.]